MTQPVPNGVLLLLPECYDSPVSKKHEVYGAVIWEATENTFSRAVVRVALGAIDISQESATIPRELLSKSPHYSTVRAREQHLNLAVRTYDESPLSDFIGKVKAILQKEKPQQEDPWETGDSVKSANLTVDTQTTEPTYLPRRPLVRWTFQTSKPQTSSFGNHIHFSKATHSLITDGVIYSIEMDTLARIRDAVSGALDNIARDYQSSHESDLLRTLGKKEVTAIRESDVLAPLRNYPILSSEIMPANSTSVIIMIITVIVFVILAIGTVPSSTERSHL